VSQTYPLDSLIRRCQPRSLKRRGRPDEHVVLVDGRARRILTKKPFFTGGRDLRYFLVSSKPGAIRCQGPLCKLKSPATQLSCEIQIHYDARCEPGREADLALALHDGAHPGAALDELIGDYVQGFAIDPGNADFDCCLDLDSIKPRLLRYLAERARSELGLLLEPTVILPLADRLHAVPISTGFFTVRACDYDGEIDLKVITDLVVSDAVRASVYYHRLGACEARIKQTIQKALIEEVTLHRFCYELGESVRRRLIEAINDQLRQEGRKITYLRLESPAATTRPRELEELTHQVECNVRDYEEKIVVEHRLQMTVFDLGMYRRAGIAELGAWAREKLEMITRSVLFEKTYFDLLLNRGLDEIESAMKRESQAVGYTVRQLLTLPALAPLDWREALPVSEVDGAYVTQNSRVEVRMCVVVKGKITRLEDPRLQPYLTPSSRLADDMCTTVRREAQLLMHRIDPERFYMRFDFPTPAVPPLREEIEQLLKEKLLARFPIDDLGVFVKPLETDITRRLADLQRQAYELEVESLPLRSGGTRERVTYLINFRIEAVHESGWHTFLSQRYPTSEEEIEAIKKILHEQVKAVLDTAPSDLLQYVAWEDLERLREVLQRRDEIFKAFGLVTSIISLRRDETCGESAAQAVLQADIFTNKEAAIEAARMVSAARLAELRLLEGKRHQLELGGVDPDDEELCQVIRRIGAIGTELLAYPLKQDKQHVPPREQAAFNIDRLGRALPAPRAGEGDGYRDGEKAS
jgi:hypothetical protein